MIVGENHPEVLLTRSVYSEKPRFCAVIVTYLPGPEFASRVTAIAGECEQVVIVDNGKTVSSSTLIAERRLEVIPLPRNVGLAAALNLGLARAQALGFLWAITFDQDSTPVPGMAAALWASRQDAADPARVAMVGPRLSEERVVHEDHRWVVPHPRCRWLFRRAPCVDQDLPGVAFVITSGALVDLGIFRQVGPMDEGLFIDYIDHDYCLRARKLGYEIMVSAGALLRHNLGAKQEFMVGSKVVRPTFHPALRLRYMLRNRRVLLRRHARDFPHWALFDRVFVHYNLLRVFVFEHHRFAKLVAALRGTWDGLMGRQGEVAQ